jgi:hypothetical protein
MALISLLKVPYERRFSSRPNSGAVIKLAFFVYLPINQSLHLRPRLKTVRNQGAAAGAMKGLKSCGRGLKVNVNT